MKNSQTKLDYPNSNIIFCVEVQCFFRLPESPGNNGRRFICGELTYLLSQQAEGRMPNIWYSVS